MPWSSHCRSMGSHTRRALALVTLEAREGSVSLLRLEISWAFI